MNFFESLYKLLEDYDIEISPLISLKRIEGGHYLVYPDKVILESRPFVFETVYEKPKHQLPEKVKEFFEQLQSKGYILISPGIVFGVGKKDRFLIEGTEYIFTYNSGVIDKNTGNKYVFDGAGKLIRGN